MKAFTIKSVAGAVLVLASAASAEDLTIVSRVDMGGGKTGTSTQYLAKDKIRTSDGESGTIFDLASGRLVIINDKKKEYYETSVQDLAAAMQKLQQQMGQGPMAAMFGKVGEVTVKKGTEPKKIAGYDTEHWVMDMGDALHFDVWAAPALEVPTQYYEARKSMYAAMGPMGPRFQKMVEEMRKVKGFPLATRVSAKMAMVKMNTLTEATEVKRGPIPASAFEVPAGYTKKEAPFKKAA
jgi:uncharacterized protein DUF4412